MLDRRMIMYMLSYSLDVAMRALLRCVRVGNGCIYQGNQRRWTVAPCW